MEILTSRPGYDHKNKPVGLSIPKEGASTLFLRCGMPRLARKFPIWLDGSDKITLHYPTRTVPVSKQPQD